MSVARNNFGSPGVSRPMQAPTHLDRPLGQVARTALRSVLLVGMAMLLILVLLPAAIAAQAAAI
jgi:hypothetical protein